ncbi:hypothetical protein [Marinicauda pacifica]|jgi:hypothetical protein|uniref:hypothetical protein n=1 Tax=Marinicauda pacifica TaxID=1133559 RepID=UPI0035C7F563
MVRNCVGTLAAGTALSLVFAAAAAAQSADLPPAQGSAELRAGFADDPHSIGVRAGGPFDAQALTGSCYGYINEAPNAVLQYQAGDYDLFLSAASDEDTMLAVSAPDGSVICDDDGAGEGFNPGIHIEDPQSGRYAIWVGTYGAGVGLPPAMLHISETGFHSSNPYSRTIEPDMAPGERDRLRAGFRNDPRRYEVSAGGDQSLASGGTGCYGQDTQAPDVWIDYSAGDLPLFITGEGDFDGVLAVHTPSGGYLCDDDSAGSLNPGIAISEPESGRYAIWYGTLGQGPAQPGTVLVSEIGFSGVDSSLDLSLPARHGDVALTGGFPEDPHTVAIQAGGASAANLATAGQLVAGGYCTGYVTREPAVELDFTTGDLPLYISAAGEQDLTLMVNTPDGAWFCDDDGSEGVNPGLVFENARSGIYDIYVGTYSQADTLVPAELFISELGFGATGDYTPETHDTYEEFDWQEEEGEPLDISLDAVFATIELAQGFTPSPYVIDLQAGGEEPVSSGIETDQYCAGYATQAPSVELTYSGSAPLAIYTEGDGDTTLAVNLPDGRWACDDDGGDSLNAGLSIPGDAQGTYDIYVGSFGGDTVPTSLVISEGALPAGRY